MQTIPKQPRGRNRRGVSLIEILVVLAILVVGILAIIRLFPSGFFSIESVGNTALADTIGSAALGSQAQDAAGLPSAILANTLTDSQYSSSDYNPTVEPDFSKTLNRSRMVQEETITVPSPKSANTAFKSVYTVSYGPIGKLVNMSLANSFTVNSMYWQDAPGNSVATLTSTTPQVDLADDQMPGQQRVLVDYANGKIAVPYARTYSQAFTIVIVAHDSGTNEDAAYTLGFTVPASGSATGADPTDPHDAGKVSFLPDSQTYYNGGWFDPTKTNHDPTDPTNTSKDYDYNTDTAVANRPTAPWKSVALYRPFQSVPVTAGSPSFTTDPYQYAMASPDITDVGGNAFANLGAIAFNPLAAGSMGIKPIKARISYLAYSWRVLHEDRDLTSGNGSSGTVTRLTLKNLKKVGDPQSDNTLYPGLIAEADPATQQSIMFLDLDTGLPIATPAINDEDALGTVGGDINVSYATGRITFPSTVATRRVRIFYAGDQDWTVAVQKAPDFYIREPDVTGTTDPMIDAAQYAFDLNSSNNDPRLFFPRCDAGKTVEVDGLVAYDTTGKAYSCPNVTVAIGDVPVQLPAGGVGYVAVDLKDTINSAFGNLTPTPVLASVTTTAVRGLSARAVVAWTERGRWKVHVVDTILTRPQSSQ